MSFNQTVGEKVELPNGWVSLSMGEVGRWFGGGTPSKANPSFWTGGNIPWVSPKDMKCDLITDAQDHITTEAIEQSATNLVEVDSVLVVVRSGILQHTLPVAVTLCQVALNQDLKAVKPRDGVQSNYLALALKAFEREILHTCTKTGTTVQSLEMPAFHRFQIPVAPLPEQRRIVAEIEKQFTRLDAGVAALRRVQANLKRYRATVLKAACEGRLVPTEAELAKTENRKTSFETGETLLARILTERLQNWQGRGKYKEPVAPDTSNSEALPMGWTWASFDQICEAVTDEGKKIAKSDYLPHGEFPVIDQGEAFIGGFSNDPALLFVGDLPVIVFGDHTRRFKLVSERFIVGADGVKIIGLTAAWNAKFLWYQFQQLDFEDRGYSRHFQFVRKAPLRLPPLAEQGRIVAEVERRLSVAEEVEFVVSANLQRATRLRQSILQKAFNGALVPQDPIEEPPNKRLERINNQPASIDELQALPRAKEPVTMPSESVDSLDQLLERLDGLGGSAEPERLLLAAGLGVDVEKFFDFLRAGRDNGSLIVPTGERGVIRRKRNAN